MQTCLITGANRGIGLELTKKFLSHQWQVIACCRHPEQAEQLKQLKHGQQLTILKCDVSHPEEIQQLGQQLNNQPIDILINNAGVIGSSTDHLDTIEVDAWLDTFKINTIAPALIAKALHNQVAMGGRHPLIVNISSIMGSIADNQSGGYYLYRSSKAALNAVTKSMAIELKPKGITVISLHPGWVQTDMGGANAPLTLEQSVHDIYHTITQLTLKDSGKFISYDGQELPW